MTICEEGQVAPRQETEAETASILGSNKTLEKEIGKAERIHGNVNEADVEGKSSAFYPREKTPNNLSKGL